MPRSTRPQPLGNQSRVNAVTAVVVSHDGAGWLPDCLAALDAQTCPPQRVAAVDTGSADDSATILRRTLGRGAVVTCPRETALGAAVQAGLDASAGRAAAADDPVTDWVWILHDDCAPDPEALQELLAAVEIAPSV